MNAGLRESGYSTTIPAKRKEHVVMLSNATQAGIGRRSLLGFAAFAAAAPMLARGAFAAAAPTDAVAAIQRLDAALLAAMKAGKQTDFQTRYAAMAPAIDQAFDLPAVLAVSVGPRWSGLPADQQARLLDAFRRYTVASYVANFDEYTGQAFTVSPDARTLPSGDVVVNSRIAAPGGDSTDLGYVMKQTASGWKVVDVLADGSISRVAVQRSDFRSVLESGGGDALLASLQRKTSDLSGGALA
jgi:phospholipid transport system substrate-binding protein